MKKRTSRHHDTLRIAVAWIVLLTPMPSFAMPPLLMAFDGDEVVVADLEIGAEIVYYSVSRYSNGFVPRTDRVSERYVDENADGEIRVALERPAPPKFLAVAVELSSGRYGVITPAGSPAREITLPAASLLEGPDQRLDRLEEAESYIEILLVRSGGDSDEASSSTMSDRAGSWAITTGDGTPADESPPGDGIIRTSISSMQPVGTSPAPPQEYETGDLLVRVAPAEMEYYIAHIER